MWCGSGSGCKNARGKGDEIKIRISELNQALCPKTTVSAAGSHRHGLATRDSVRACLT
jgi:hypothetical protein